MFFHIIHISRDFSRKKGQGGGELRIMKIGGWGGGGGGVVDPEKISTVVSRKYYSVCLVD